MTSFIRDCCPSLDRTARQFGTWATETLFSETAIQSDVARRSEAATIIQKAWLASLLGQRSVTTIYEKSLEEQRDHLTLCGEKEPEKWVCPICLEGTTPQIDSLGRQTLLPLGVGRCLIKVGISGQQPKAHIFHVTCALSAIKTAKENGSETPYACLTCRTRSGFRAFQSHSAEESDSEGSPIFEELPPDKHFTVEQLVRKILQGTINPNALGESGRTPLHLAVLSLDFNAVAALVISGKVNFEVRDVADCTPIMWALAKKADPIVRLLANAGATWKVDSEPKRLVPENRTDIARKIKKCVLDSTSKPTIEPKDVKSPLGLAVDLGELECMELLITNNADPDKRDSGDKTLLHRAVEHGNSGAVEVLLGSVEEVDPRDSSFGRTPLHWAAVYGYSECYNLLVKSGADEEFKDMRGLTPIEITKRKSRVSLNLRKRASRMPPTS